MVRYVTETTNEEMQTGASEYYFEGQAERGMQRKEANNATEVETHSILIYLIMHD